MMTRFAEKENLMANGTHSKNFQPEKPQMSLQIQNKQPQLQESHLQQLQSQPQLEELQLDKALSQIQEPLLEQILAEQLFSQQGQTQSKLPQHQQGQPKQQTSLTMNHPLHQNHRYHPYPSNQFRTNLRMMALQNKCNDQLNQNNSSQVQNRPPQSNYQRLQLLDMSNCPRPNEFGNQFSTHSSSQKQIPAEKAMMQSSPPDKMPQIYVSPNLFSNDKNHSTPEEQNRPEKQLTDHLHSSQLKDIEKSPPAKSQEAVKKLCKPAQLLIDYESRKGKIISADKIKELVEKIGKEKKNIPEDTLNQVFQDLINSAMRSAVKIMLKDQLGPEMLLYTLSGKRQGKITKQLPDDLLESIFTKCHMNYPSISKKSVKHAVSVALRTEYIKFQNFQKKLSELNLSFIDEVPMNDIIETQLGMELDEGDEDEGKLIIDEGDDDEGKLIIDEGDDDEGKLIIDEGYVEVSLIETEEKYAQYL